MSDGSDNAGAMTFGRIISLRTGKDLAHCSGTRIRTVRILVLC
jgi:hypothetical protein